jgi:hypothetical protein
MKWKLFDLLITVTLLVAGAAGEALAQDDAPDIEEDPFEVGAQLTFMGIDFPRREVGGPPGSTAAPVVLPRDHIAVAGFGGRFGYNVNKYVALEAEANVLPRRNLNEVFQNRRTQFFAGVRAGRRWEKFGLFAKVRPGAMNFENYGTRGPCTATPPGSQDCFDDARTFFAADLGGVVEYYPSERVIFRVDAGDTVIRFRDSGPVTFPPIGTSPGSSVYRRAETTHNFQMTFGLGFRF